MSEQFKAYLIERVLEAVFSGSLDNGEPLR